MMQERQVSVVFVQVLHGDVQGVHCIVEVFAIWPVGHIVRH